MTARNSSQAIINCQFTVRIRNRVYQNIWKTYNRPHLSLVCVVITSIQKHISISTVTGWSAMNVGSVPRKSTDFSYTLRSDRFCNLPSFLFPIKRAGNGANSPTTIRARKHVGWLNQTNYLKTKQQELKCI